MVRQGPGVGGAKMNFILGMLGWGCLKTKVKAEVWTSEGNFGLLRLWIVSETGHAWDLSSGRAEEEPCQRSWEETTKLVEKNRDQRVSGWRVGGSVRKVTRTRVWQGQPGGQAWEVPFGLAGIHWSFFLEAWQFMGRTVSVDRGWRGWRFLLWLSFFRWEGSAMQ